MPKLPWHDLQFCLRRAPRTVVQLLRENPGQLFVAGGFIRSCITQEHVNDIDLFAPSKDLARTYATKLADLSGVKLIESENAFTIPVRSMTIQVIHRWTFTDPEACIESFDFTIAKAAFWCVDSTGEKDPTTHLSQWSSACCDAYYMDLAAKRLVYTSPKREEEAGGSMLRLLKFYQRGYRAPLDTIGAVIGRLATKVHRTGNEPLDEFEFSKVITGLLREVDPNLNAEHMAYLAPETTEQEESE